jgi:hypothetical protein
LTTPHAFKETSAPTATQDRPELTTEALDDTARIQRDEWLVGRSYISQKSMATLSDRGAEKQISLDNNDKEVDLIAA